MAKLFIHRDFDRVSECEWTYISEDDNMQEVVDAALEHLRTCEKGLRYSQNSAMLRATIREVIRNVEPKDKSKLAG